MDEALDNKKKAAAVGNDGYKEVVLTEDNGFVKRLCYDLELLLTHNIKAPLFGNTKLWKYLENLERCLPGSSATLQKGWLCI